MSHQGHSPDNLPCWSRAKAAQGEEKKKVAQLTGHVLRAAAESHGPPTFSVGLQLPSLAPSLPLSPLVCYLNPLDCRAGSGVWHAVVPASRFGVSTAPHRSGPESRL